MFRKSTNDFLRFALVKRSSLATLKALQIHWNTKKELENSRAPAFRFRKKGTARELRAKKNPENSFILQDYTYRADKCIGAFTHFHNDFKNDSSDNMNKKILLIQILFAISVTCYSQQVEVKNEYEKGQLKDGYKVGVWEYFESSHEVALKVDYNEGTLVYLKPDTSKYYIKTDSVCQYKTIYPYPRYLGSYNEFYRIIATNLRYPDQARWKEIEKTVFLEFQINEQGKAVKIKVLNDEENYFTDELLATFKLIPNIWLSATYEGQNVPAKFILPFQFKLTGGPKSQRFDNDKFNNLEGKKLEEVIISAPSPKY